MHQPKEIHWLAAMKVLPYIKSCPRKELVYRKHGYVHMSKYSDSGYADDRGDRKSTIGYCTFVERNLVT